MRWMKSRSLAAGAAAGAEVRPRKLRDGGARWRRYSRAAHRETPQGRALVPLLKTFPLPRTAFDALIEGVEMDLGARRYETFADLYEYCIRVASAVGLMCLEIFGYEDPRSRQYATDLGVALQLTNILRDVPGDFERGRLYVPLEDLRRFGCTENDLRAEIEHAGAGVRSPAVKELLRFQGMRARQYYARAAAALPQVRRPPAGRRQDHGVHLLGAADAHRARRLRRFLAGRPDPASAARPSRPRYVVQNAPKRGLTP